MDNDVIFSLSYEQFFQETEKQIKKYNLSKEGSYYIQELSKASDFLHFWYRLANSGYLEGWEDYGRIEADWRRLNALIYKKSG